LQLPIRQAGAQQELFSLVTLDALKSARQVLAPLFNFTMQKNRPDTPCVAVCSTTFDEICRGCGRTVSEVAHWVFMTQEEKDLVWERITAEGYPRRQG
jgi:uncharacterized protein